MIDYTENARKKLTKDKKTELVNGFSQFSKRQGQCENFIYQ